MKTKKLIVPALIILAILPSSLFSNTLSFFNDISAKNSSLSESGAAFSKEAFSSFVNPAGLALLERQSVSLSFYNLFEGSYISAVSYALPLLEAGTVSISGLLLDAGKIEERDINNIVTGEFSDSYKSVLLSYAYTLFHNYSAGVTVKYLNHDFYGISASGYGLDLGALVKLPYDIRLAAGIINIVKPVLSYNSSSSDTLPLEYRASLGYEIPVIEDIRGRLQLTAGLSKEEFSPDTQWSAGASYSAYGIGSVSGGINSEGFSAGASITLFGFTADYAYVKMPYDFSHRFVLSCGFGDDIRAAENRIKDQKEKLRSELVTKIKTETLETLKTDMEKALYSQDYEAAAASVEKALAWEPSNAFFTAKKEEIAGLSRRKQLSSLFVEADKLIEDKLYIDAMVSLKSILDLDPNNSIAWKKFRDTQEIVRKLGQENIVQEQKNRAVIQKNFDAGLDQYTAGNYADAIEQWDKVIKASPLQRQVYNYIKSAQEKIRKVEVKAEKQKSEREKTISTLYNKAVLQYTKGEFQESMKTWQQLLEIDPENTDAKNNIKKIAEEFKKLQQQELGW
ncbi:MAG: hypothetical protein JXR81_10620 [Candidatus Goldbacteria bacterium]|nr:hypothetical protein [Candidatus Goldiibacteriota bacterium]